MAERSGSATILVTAEDTYQTSSSLSGIEEKLPGELFMRCHKSYIINISKISQIEVYGRWTYVVKLKGTERTALMTAANYEIIREMYG